MVDGVGGITGISRGHIMYCSSRSTINYLGAGGGICGFSDHYVKFCSFIGELVQRGTSGADVFCGGGIIRNSAWRRKKLYY